jgi:hypothetical protein
VTGDYVGYFLRFVLYADLSSLQFTK